MKLERYELIKRTALAAVFFIFGIVARAEDKVVSLKSPDDRGLRLFDEAVKLSRRYDSDAVKQVQPLKSMLIELSEYHEDEQAGFLDAEGNTRSDPPAPIGPWALARLGKLEWQLNDFDAALASYERLGEDFKGLDLVDLDPKVPIEKSEIASLKGRLRVLQSVLAKAKDPDLEDQAFDLIMKLQKDPDARYGPVALRALWDLLDAIKAPAEVWEAKTKKLEKHEKDPNFSAAVFMALSHAYECLGNAKKSKEFHELAQKKQPKTAVFSVLPEGALKNLITCASPRS